MEAKAIAKGLRVSREVFDNVRNEICDKNGMVTMEKFNTSYLWYGLWFLPALPDTPTRKLEGEGGAPSVHGYPDGTMEIIEEMSELFKQEWYQHLFVESQKLFTIVMKLN